MMANKELSIFLHELDDLMACWLCDNTDKVFEEQPFIDGLRNQINEELWECSNDGELGQTVNLVALPE